jgi:hypothetical protein
MRRAILFALFTVVFFGGKTPLLAQSEARDVVVFSEPEFPAPDSVAPSETQFAVLFPKASKIGADQLPAAVSSHSCHVLVLPYGSAFPEESWPAIKSFLDRGGNLLVLGGMPFTRAAYHDAQGWHLRDYSVRFIRPLMIDQYQETPGSGGLQFQNNP